MDATPQLTERLRHHFNAPDLTVMLSNVAGGDTHQSFVVQVISDSIKSSAGDNIRLFLKQNQREYVSVLQAEYHALRYFQDSDMAPFYPKPILFDDGLSPRQYPHCLLLMEYHELNASTADNAASLGERLAMQHSIKNDRFGWSCDNFIGATAQANRWQEVWSRFFAEQRLTPQLALASSRCLDQSLVSSIKRLINNLDDYFFSLSDQKITPSLLHGDLWGGNLAIKRPNGTAFFYDPAPYFGDPEVDIAMTKLFGQLPASFYAAYHDVHPVRAGRVERAKVYDLYHLLNHFNLFGTSYEQSIFSVVKQLTL